LMMPQIQRNYFLYNLLVDTPAVRS
jgi:hypothetical protein